MKYIRTKDYHTIIFSGGLSHAEVARKLNVEVESAGFFSCDPDSVQCSGESISLGIKSDPEDTEKIASSIQGY